MGFFKKIGKAIGKGVKSVGRFAKKVASSGVGRTILGVAATAVAGPLAGAGIATLTKAIGKTKAGNMVSKVVSDGVVKVDKVVSTLKKAGVEPKQALVDQVVSGVKAAAEGIAEKPIGTNQTAKQAISQSASSSYPEQYQGAELSGSKSKILETVKKYYHQSIEWLKLHWKQVLLFGVLPLGGLYIIYVLFFKSKSNRRKRRR